MSTLNELTTDANDDVTKRVKVSSSNAAYINQVRDVFSTKLPAIKAEIQANITTIQNAIDAGNPDFNQSMIDEANAAISVIDKAIAGANAADA